jgi:hypothetical protein
MQDDDAVLTGWYAGKVSEEALFPALAEASPEYVEEFLGAPA